MLYGNNSWGGQGVVFYITYLRVCFFFGGLYHSLVFVFTVTLIWEGAGEVVVGGGLPAVECWLTALRTLLTPTKLEGKKGTS